VIAAGRGRHCAPVAEMLARMLLLQSKQCCKGRAYFSARQHTTLWQGGHFPVKSLHLSLQSARLFPTHGLWLFLACKKRTKRSDRQFGPWAPETDRRRFKPLPPKFTRPVRYVQSCLPSHLHVCSFTVRPSRFSQFLPGLPAPNLDDEFLMKRERQFHPLMIPIDHAFDCCRRVLCRKTLTIRLQKWSKSTAT
jgi:hypothetical protein